MENKRISIELTIAQWNIVMQGVTGLPFAQVAEIVPEMKSQAEAQIRAIGMSTESQPS